VRFPVSGQNTLTRKIYLYSQGDYESLSNELRDINWENKFNKTANNPDLLNLTHFFLLFFFALVTDLVAHDVYPV
jgi:hypothetical protein